MPSEKLLLINFTPENVEHIQVLLAGIDPEIGYSLFATIAEAEPHLNEGSIVLVVLQVDEKRKRPDQDIRRIKRALSRPVPVLLLIIPDLARKVKDYLRAGADEYWILPLDTASFPPRFCVLLEWGQSAAGGEERAQLHPRYPTGSGGHPLWHRFWGVLRRFFTTSESEPVQACKPVALIAGKWEKMRRLGFGSFGEVWLVGETGKDTPAVAKIPHSRKLNTKFIREAANLKRLRDHPNAVQLKEVVKEDGKVVIIQEYVEGTTLQELLDQGMENDAKEKAFLELLAVVACAHEQNLMHRDIKPENIIITPSGVLKLLDFGTGKDLTRRSISSTVIGSRPFMAPEQIMGKSRLTSDVWALGVILYALSTGFLPFYDDNEKQLMDLILELEPELPRNLEPDLPEELEAIILKCLRKDWTGRYRTAVELREALLTAFPHFGKGQVLVQV